MHEAWIRVFFQWLDRHPDIISFIWFEYIQAEGGTADWRVTADPRTATTFREGLRGVTLAPPPLEPVTAGP